MPSETPFRAVLLIVAGLSAGVTFYFRLRAGSSGESISRRAEGYAFAAFLRLAGLLLGATTLTYLLAPQYLQWAALPLPDWLRWIAAAGGALCSLLMYWTLASLGHNLTDTVVTRADATLVTQGPYRWVRHPFYVTAALLMAAATILAANWLIGLFSALVLILLAVRTPQEEQMLIARFGQQYRDYMARTGRLLPRLRR